MKGKSTHLPMLIALATGAFILAMSGMAGAALASRQPILSLRVIDSNFEAELHAWRFGLLYLKVDEIPLSGLGCDAKIDREFIYLRYFFKGIQDSWYLGVGTFNEGIVSDQGCRYPVDTASGGLVIAGYHWLWDSGLNLDLGFRPGLVAVGWSF